jgi:hypothetical protein
MPAPHLPQPRRATPARLRIRSAARAVIAIERMIGSAFAPVPAGQPSIRELRPHPAQLRRPTA